jgi:hypothetical protein
MAGQSYGSDGEFEVLLSISTSHSGRARGRCQPGRNQILNELELLDVLHDLVVPVDSLAVSRSLAALARLKQSIIEFLFTVCFFCVEFENSTMRTLVSFRPG